MRVPFPVAAGMVWCVVAAATPPDFITCKLALAMSGEIIDVGRCSASVVPAPDQPEGVYSLEIRFRMTAHRAGTWVDCMTHPSPPLDLSASSTHRLWIRANQPADYLTIKIVDPENPGTNHSAIEGAVLHDGGALPAEKWVPVDLAFPEDATRRDTVTYVGFYLAGANERIPLDRDLVFHVGRFAYVPPKRVPWPPRPSPTASRLVPLRPLPLTPAGPWIRVSGRDNQTGHLATFTPDGLEFDADADGWNEYVWSDATKLPLRPLTTYRLQFDYDVLRAPSGPAGATFYSLVRAQGTIREDVGWQRWSGSAGTSGSRTVTFTTHDMPGYYLNFGIRHHGKIRLTAVQLWEVPGKGVEE